MTIYQLESVIRALESKDRLDSDDREFIKFLLEHRLKEDLTNDEARWLSDITDQLRAHN